MYAIVEVVLKSYKPLQLEVGMLFLNSLKELWVLDHNPIDEDAFYIEFGAPMEVVIIDGEGKEIVQHEQIGLWDDGEDSDEYTLINPEILSLIFDYFEGLVKISLDPETELPLLVENRVVLSSPIDDEDYEEEEN
jgi:hypothetical protein